MDYETPSAETSRKFTEILRLKFKENVVKRQFKLFLQCVALVETTFPVGYICVALFSLDKKWYRAKVMGVSQDQLCYDIFFVDHGDREWVGKVSAL